MRARTWATPPSPCAETALPGAYLLLAAQLSAAVLAACFAAPQPVRIDGWSEDAMEPFISRDGRFLFFNSSNAPGRQTDIYWARRIDDLDFAFQGPVPGANSPALDGVPSVARDGTMSLISPRDYDRLHATVWIGRWTGRSVQALSPQPALAPARAGGFNMDAEISADGRRLYFTANDWAPDGPPRTSVFRLARRTTAGWRIDPDADSWFAGINGQGLAYAAGVSADDLQFFYTRLAPGRTAPQIMVATRAAPNRPFSDPANIEALKGFVEAPSVAPDGALYLHQKRGDRFIIVRSARICR
jgi:hypothetical protein